MAFWRRLVARWRHLTGTDQPDYLRRIREVNAISSAALREENPKDERVLHEDFYARGQTVLLPKPRATAPTDRR
jgi:hypothetical protein